MEEIKFLVLVLMETFVLAAGQVGEELPVVRPK